MNTAPNITAAPSSSSPSIEADQFARAVALSFVVMTLSIVAALATVFVFRTSDVAPLTNATDFVGPYEINRILLEYVPYYNPAPQRMAHRIAVVVSAIIFLLIVHCPGRWLRHLEGKYTGWLIFALVVPSVALLVPIQAIPRRAYLLSVVMSAALILSIRHGKGLWWKVVGLIAIALVLGAAIIPGPGSVMSLAGHSRSKVAEFNNHYSWVIGGAQRIASGREMFSEWVPAYGVGMPSLLGGLDSFLGPMNFSSYVNVFACSNLIYLLLSAWLLWITSKKNGLYTALCLLAVLLIYCTHGVGILYPNQAGWRTIGFVLIPIVLHNCRGRTSLSKSGIAGVCSAMALAANTESGIAMSIGLLAYAYLAVCQSNGWRPIELLKGAGVFLACWALTVGVGIIMMTVIARQPVDLTSVYRIFSTTSFWMKSNYGAASLNWQIIGVTVFFCSTCSLFLDLQRIRTVPDDMAEVRVFLSVGLIIWFSYYMNRPAEMNMSSYLVPAGVPIFNVLQALRLSREDCKPLESWAPRITIGFLLMAVIEPFFVQRAYEAVVTVSASRPVVEGAVVSGVRFEEEYGRELISKSNYLRDNFGEDSIVYFTQDSFVMPLLVGQLSAIPILDPGECFDRTRFDTVVQSVLQSRKDWIFFDVPSRDDHTLREIQDQIKAAISGRYHHSKTVSHWECWELK